MDQRIPRISCVYNADKDPVSLQNQALLRWGREGSGKGARVMCRVGLSLRVMGSGTTTGGSSVWGHAFPLTIPNIFCLTFSQKGY